jgi:hypothetical protein
MQKTLVAILVVILAGASPADNSALGLIQDCWKQGDRDDAVSNTIVVCMDGESIEVSVFYPNHGHDSTTCRSSGEIKSIDWTTFALRTGRGQCENGNTLAPSDWTCTLLNEDELNCLDRSFNQVHLKREATEADDSLRLPSDG